MDTFNTLLAEIGENSIDDCSELKQVIDRCKAIGMDCGLERDKWERTYLEVSIPAGRDKRPIHHSED